MPFAPERPEQIRQILCAEYVSQSLETEESKPDKASHGKANSSARHQRSGADTGGDGERSTREVDRRLRFLKRLHGGFPIFDDARPDPGCSFESWEYQDYVDPAFYGNKPLTYDLATQYDPADPRVQVLTENAREAHWKLTAPKGLSSLKGIPELQQLLAYTSAAVAQYAVGSDQLGLPGGWPDFVGPKPTVGLRATSRTHSTCLIDDNSLIGQLCPALRLCLAAEVATGLLCDSQPAPPDTPEHASALLLFLAAALKQAEQECQPVVALPAGGSWRQNPSLSNCKALVDFYSCASIEAIMNQIQHYAHPANDSDSGSSASSDSIGPQEQQQQQPCEESVNVISAAVKMAGRIHLHRPRQECRQEPSTAAAAAEQQLIAEQLLHVGHTLSAYLRELSRESTAAEAAAPVPPAAAAASSSSGSAAAGATSSCGLCAAAAGPPSAADVAWQVATVGGGAALSLVYDFFESFEGPENEDERKAVEGIVKSSCAVCLSLLVSHIHGLFEHVLETLEDAASSLGQEQQQCRRAPLQQQQQHGSCCSGAAEGSAHDSMVHDILSEMLQLSHLAANLMEAVSAAAAATISRSSCSRSAGSCSPEQQQQQQAAAAAARTAAGAGVQPHETGGRQLSEADSKAGGISKPLSPQVWFQHAFSCLQGTQISPVCLHAQLLAMQGPLQQQDPAAAAAAGAAAAAATPRPETTSYVEQEVATWWLSAVNSAYTQWSQRQRRQQVGSTDSCSMGSSPSASTDDPVQCLVSSFAGFKNFVELLTPVVEWQRSWLESAKPDVDKTEMHEHAVHQVWMHRWQRRADQRTEAEKQAETDKAPKDKQHSDHKSSQQRQQQPGRKAAKSTSKAAAGKRVQREQRRAGAGSEEEGSDSAALRVKQQHSKTHSDSSEDDETGRAASAAEAKAAAERKLMKEVEACELCEQDGAFLAVAGCLHSSSKMAERLAGRDNSSSSSSGSAGLYGQFPVSWSDPFMMRRLLWDLLGKIKPTAQAWFKKHARMCPHRMSADKWHMVVMSLARHIWGPPGEWDAQLSSQVELLLPLHVRVYDRKPSPEEDQARCAYAQSLNAAFAQQGPDAQAAALLSLQALLALDPHGARVQPRPELLYYTPSGFHAAVCKTLMQALQLPPYRPAEQVWRGASSCRSLAAAASRSASQQQQSLHPHGSSGDQQQQSTLGPHKLQAWGEVLLPSYYVWWHIGLLAYHQQQQQHSPSNSCSSSNSQDALQLQDLYDDPNARLFAVGYAARQLSSRGQLERLLSNPPVPVGLAIAPADWAAVQPEQLLCGHCNTRVYRKQPEGQHAVCCCLCWKWYCNQDCYSMRCPPACQVDPLIQTKAARRWRILQLLKTSLVPFTKEQQLQQQQQQQEPTAAGAGAGAASSAAAPAAAQVAIQPPTHGIPQGSSNILPGAFRSLLKAHPASALLQQQQQQQQPQRRQQLWRQGLQPQHSYTPLYRRYETPPWGVTGAAERWSQDGARIVDMTEKLAGKLVVSGLYVYTNQEHDDDWSSVIEMFGDQVSIHTLEKFSNQALTARQQRQQQQQRRQQSSDWYSYSQSYEARLQQQQQRWGQSAWSDPPGLGSSSYGGPSYSSRAGYGPHPLGATGDLDDFDTFDLQFPDSEDTIPDIPAESYDWGPLSSPKASSSEASQAAGLSALADAAAAAAGGSSRQGGGGGAAVSDAEDRAMLDRAMQRAVEALRQRCDEIGRADSGDAEDEGPMGPEGGRLQESRGGHEGPAAAAAAAAAAAGAPGSSRRLLHASLNGGDSPRQGAADGLDGDQAGEGGNERDEGSSSLQLD